MSRFLRSFSRRTTAMRWARRTFSSQARTRISAAVCNSSEGPFEVQELYLRPPKPDEVRVRIHATGLCHTDLATKMVGDAFPIVLGHEGVGRVEKVGSHVTTLKEGDEVVMTYASCGGCPCCLTGKPSYCDDHATLNFGGVHPDGSLAHFSQEEGGLEVQQPWASSSGQGEVFGSYFQQSSFATHSVVAAKHCVKVSPSLTDLPLEALAPLGCGVQTGAGAIINTLSPRVGESVAVLGCGAVGISAIMAAKLVGCSTIVAVDTNQNRLEMASELGATHTVKVEPSDPEVKITEEVKDFSEGGVMYALDTTSNAKAAEAVFQSLRPLGQLGIVGAVPGRTLSIGQLDLLPGRAVRGVIQGDSVPQLFLPKLMEFQKQGRFPFDQLITYYQGLDQLNQAVADSHDSEKNVVKPVIIVGEQ